MSVQKPGYTQWTQPAIVTLLKPVQTAMAQTLAQGTQMRIVGHWYGSGRNKYSAETLDGRKIAYLRDGQFEINSGNKPQ